MSEATKASQDDKNDRSFITEVPQQIGRQRSQGKSTLQGVTENEEHDIRGPEFTNTAVAVADSVRIIEKLGAKQQSSKSVRSMIQKAAQKTILVVRTKNATQAAENVTIRFNKNDVTDVPRSIVLRDVYQRVLASMNFSSSRKRHLFLELFDKAPEIDALLKDMFWYLTAHCFQPGRHKHVEESFYQRIADSFTSLFIRVQVQPASRDSGFFDTLPDVLAQILFMALYEGFPKSRKSITSTNLREDILRVCYEWVLGFVPAELDASHWMPVDQESPKRIAALAGFPAMRNRMLRAERIERTKVEIRSRHGSAIDKADDRAENDEDQDDAALDEKFKLPVMHSGPNASHVETRERCVYQMQNSPLVDTFLKTHHLEANATHLKVQLRMTNGTRFNLSNQRAIQLTTLPRERRRRLINPRAFTEVLTKIEGFGDSVQTSYASEKRKMHNQDVAERRSLAQEQRALEAQFSELRHQGTKMHEISNLIASKSRITGSGPTAEPAILGSKDTAKVSPRSGPPKLIPRPPPPRV